MAFKKAIRFALRSSAAGTMISESGGMVMVVAAGGAAKVDLFNMDGTAIANPVAFTNGYVEFQFDGDTNSVDLYGVSPTGHGFVAKGVEPSGDNEINIDTSAYHTVLAVPFSFADVTADATETDSGIDLPANALVLPNPVVRVLTADATETITVGVLSTEAAGDADGFIVAASVATAGVVKGTVTNGANTMGALFEAQDSANAGDIAPEGHVVVSTSRSVSYTLSAGSDTAAGIIHLPILLT
jgi:hypothetical protein